MRITEELNLCKLLISGSLKLSIWYQISLNSLSSKMTDWVYNFIFYFIWESIKMALKLSEDYTIAIQNNRS